MSLSLPRRRSSALLLSGLSLALTSLPACAESPPASAAGSTKLSAADASSPTPKADAPPPDAAAKRDAELKAGAKDAALLKLGQENYIGFCQSCHGVQKEVAGDAPSNLFDPKWYHGGRPSEIEQTILKGIVDKGMPGWGEVLPAEDTTAVLAYILSFQKS